MSESGTEWATPGRIWRPLADALGGFDLDPASGAEDVPIADERYTEADDGLAQPWFGNVWLNPPYSKKENPKWAKKAAAEARRSEVDTITALVPNSTGAHWYQDHYGTADLETHIRGRVEFVGAKDHDPSFYSVIVTWGEVPEEYVAALDGLGEVRRIPDRGTRQTSIIHATDGGRNCAVDTGTPHSERGEQP